MGKKTEVLWISYCAPYDKVPHAGGQLHNFYLKQLIRDRNMKVHLISFCYQKEFQKLDYKTYGIVADILQIDTLSAVRYLANAVSIYNPFDLYGHCLPAYRKIILMSALRRLKRSGYRPDVMILQWTQIVFLANKIQRLFPEAKMICIEEDVTYQACERKAEVIPERAKYWQQAAHRVKKVELEMLSKANLVVVNNLKDQNLLREQGQDSRVWQAYYHDYGYVLRKPNSHKIMFFGALSREENYLSVGWFIEKVMPLLEDVIFEVVGANPPEQLLKYASDHVVFTGFVQEVGAYFESSLCMVAPLIMGAGIKIKVLEALSAGVPVLTNQIGIEGIPAVAGRDYLHCETPEEYAQAIRTLQNSSKEVNEISKNAVKMMKEHYNLMESAALFRRWIQDLGRDSSKSWPR